MASEQAKVCTCPHCTMESDGECATKDARAASQYGPTGNPFPPQAEVVRDPKIPTASEASEIALKFINHFFNNPGRAKPRASIPADPLRDDDLRLMAFIRSHLPSESPATKRGERSFTPRGFENYCEIIDQRGRTVTVRESSQAGEGWVWIFCQDASGADGQLHLGKWQSYSPHLSIDNARDVVDALNRWIADQQSPCSNNSRGGGSASAPTTTSPPVSSASASSSNSGPSSPSSSNPPAWDFKQARAIVEAAIPADRQKHADLAGKVRELADYVKILVPADSNMGRLARQVFAMMEAR